MAKKFGKFLLFTAAVSSAAAAVYYYIQKKGTTNDDPEKEDSDDLSEASDAAEPSRNYVSLTPDAATDSDKTQEKDTFVPLDKVAPAAEEAVPSGSSSDAAETEVEEFFDEGDETDEEPPINDN